MSEKPRPPSRTFFRWRELVKSIIQGIVISAGVLLVYQYSVRHDYNEVLTRSMVFSTLIAANIFLTLVNRSDYYPVWVSLRYRNPLVPVILGITVALTGCILYVPSVADFFQVTALTLPKVMGCIGIAFFSVAWIELTKHLSRQPIGNTA